MSASPTTTTTSRADRFEQALAEQQADAILGTGLPNVRYLTGYSGSNGLTVVGPGRRVFVTDFRYLTQSEAEVDPAFERRIATQELVGDLPEILGTEEIRLGFEAHIVTVRAHEALRELLG